MARISFKAKIETVFNMDESEAYSRIKVPELTRRHCDMNAMRQHPKFGSYANSDLFPSMLRRLRKERLGDYVRLDRIPADINVDTSSFLAEVTLDV